MAPEDQVPLWTVTSQQETVDLAPNGNYLTGTRISFRTRSGALGSVFVTADQYTPAEARRRITARAADLEEVHNMTGEG